MLCFPSPPTSSFPSNRGCYWQSIREGVKQNLQSKTDAYINHFIWIPHQPGLTWRSRLPTYLEDQILMDVRLSAPSRETINGNESKLEFFYTYQPMDFQCQYCISIAGIPCPHEKNTS